MKIAIMGFGIVGSGAYEAAKLADGIEIKKILDLRVRPGYEDIADKFTSDINDIISDEEIELVVETMGGVDVPREYVTKCLKAGKHVVTSNKNLVSACYQELNEAAAEGNAKLRFTPAAGGGIPWLFNLRRAKRCDVLTEVRGIVNGTCNYILDSMHKSGANFEDALAEAQKLGYAEKDPTSDIEGTDTLRKCVISTNLAFDANVTEDQIPACGISSISAEDIQFFNSNGYTCKLMMYSKVMDGKLSAYVEPAIFGPQHLEANVKANNNLITLVGENVGTLSFFGQGAGSAPTGQSVIQDVIDIKDGVEMNAPFHDYFPAAETSFIDNESQLHTYYFRHDHPSRMITEITDKFAVVDGTYYCISKPIPVVEMHELAKHMKQVERPFFFAHIHE